MDKPDQTPAASFAAYAARALIARKGYQPGTVPEARALAESCDIVLTRADGLSLSIVGIVDRETHPDRRSGLTKEELKKIGEACLVYSGRAGFRKLPVWITIVEIGAGLAPAEDIERLKSLSSAPFSTVQLCALSLATGTQELWSNAPLRGRAMTAFFRGLLKKSRIPDNELTPKPPAAMAEHRPLSLTYGLLAGLTAIFIAETVFRIGPDSGLLTPDIKTLIALGALDKTLVM